MIKLFRLNGGNQFSLFSSSLLRSSCPFIDIPAPPPLTFSLTNTSCSFATSSRAQVSHAANMAQQFSKKYVESVAAVEDFAKRKQTPISVKHFLDFSRHREDPNTGVQSCDFIFNQELPTRIAHITKLIDGLPFSLQNVGPVQKCKEWYLQTMQDIVEFQKAYKTHIETKGDPKSIIAKSLSLCNKTLHRHQAVVTTMAQGILEVKRNFNSDLENRSLEEELKGYEKFLDRLYMSRIGTRMLMSQHIELFSIQDEMKPSARRTVGVFDEQLDIRALIEEAASNSNFLVMQKYADAPDWDLILYDRKKRGGSVPTKPTKNPLTFSYVPSHLYHIVFELLKNSMRAVVEYHKDAEKLPAIRIIAVKGDQDLTIKIEDQGGGVPLSLVESLFAYSYSTAEPPAETHTDMNHAPLAGFGYGLPMSRLYARYFGGDLKLVSTEGYGMDALVYLKVLAHDARETLTELEAMIDYETMPYETLLEKARDLRRENQRLSSKIDKIATIMAG